MNKILIISVDFFPKIGGISLMTHHLANGFCQNGWEVSVLAPADALIPADYSALYSLVVDRESNPKRRANLEGLRERRRIFDFLCSLGEFDHVLLLHPFYYGPAALDYARSIQATISCYFHGFELKSQLLHRDKLVQRVLGKFSPIKTLRQSTLCLAKSVDYVFTNSSETAEIVRPVRSSNVVITGCGLDVETYREKLMEPKVSSLKSGIVEQGMTLGFVGRIVESKNLEFLIDLLRHLPSYKLLVVGDGPKKKELQKRAKVSGVGDRITWAGRVSEDGKWEAIDKMDLLCLPSRKLNKGQVEGFGIVMLEATLRGIPVAVSHEGGMRDFILEKNGIYLDINNKKNSADKIQSFFQDGGEVLRTVSRAQKLLGESLTYDKIAEGLIELLQSSQLDAEEDKVVA